MTQVNYCSGKDVSADEVAEFYRRVQVTLNTPAAQIRRMMTKSAVFVAARADGRLIGIARGVCDGVRGYLTECKLDPQYQGPAAVTRKDGRIEHDCSGIAAELARQVITGLQSDGAQRIDVVAWNTEVDFLEELGFKRQGGLVGLSLQTGAVADAKTLATVS